MADNEKNKERLKEITDSIEQGIRELFQSDRYMQYLQTMSRFHRYSVNNTMLIYMQKPDATLVAGFNKWHDQFSRNVMRGERGIRIIAPTPFKKRIEEEKLDPNTKLPALDESGNVVMEEKEIKIPTYKVVSVFDVSQTEGKPLPTLASNLTGNVQQYEVFMEALRRSSPVPIGFEAMEPNKDGYFSETNQRIAIRTGMSEVQTVSASIHEITHVTLHNYEQARLAAAQGDETAEPPKPKDRRTEEVEAESVSYAVCQYYDIQTGENSFGYIAAWSKGKELPELRASLETINRTASGLISDIDNHFAKIVKERGIDLNQQKEALEQPEPLAQAAPSTPGVDAMLPNTLELVLDEYPMPDSELTVSDLEACGYLDGDMLPLSKDRALELFKQDLTIYMIEDGGAGNELSECLSGRFRSLSAQRRRRAAGYSFRAVELAGIQGRRRGSRQLRPCLHRTACRQGQYGGQIGGLVAAVQQRPSRRLSQAEPVGQRHRCAKTGRRCNLSLCG